MQGLFGVAHAGPAEAIADLEALVRSTAQPPEHFTIATWNGPSHKVQIGRLGTSILQQDPIAVQGSWACALEGEYLRSSRGQFEQAPLTALTCWRELHSATAARLQGSFTLAVYDPEQQTLSLCNDRFGQRPLYYFHDGTRLAFAPITRLLRALADVSPSLDLDAVAQFFRYQQILDDRSLFSEFKLLPPASILVFDLRSGALQHSTYWDVSGLDLERPLPWDAVIENGVDLVRQAVRRCFQGNHQIGVYLSGGIDSRTILAALGEQARGLHAINYGHPAGGDAKYARAVARVAGVNLKHLDPEHSDWTREFLDFYFLASYTPFHYFNSGNNTVVREARNWLDVNVSGVMGDAVIGDLHNSHSLLRKLDRPGMFDVIDHFWGGGHFNPGAIDLDQAVLLFRPEFAAELNDRARAALGSLLDRYTCPWNRRHDFLYLHTRARRGLGNLLQVERCWIETRTPFYDYELVDFFYSVPYEYRIDRGLQIGLLNALSPRLSRIAVSGSNIPPLLNPRLIKLHLIALTLRRQATRLLPWLPPIPTSQVSSWPRRTANDTAPWIAAVLLSAESRLGPWLQPAYVHSLIRRLQAGDVVASWTVASLLSLELAWRHG